MKLYYYVKDSQRVGPFLYDKLKTEGINPDTLIWFEGLPSWQFARDLEELEPIFNPIVEENKSELLDAEEIVKETEPELNNQNISMSPDKLEESSNQETVPNEEIDVIPTTTSQRMFANPFGTSGRIRRMEYWLSYLIFILYYFLLILFISTIVSSTDDALPVFILILLLPAYWFIIVQGAKRCHDRGNSGWYQLIPFYSLWMAFAEGDNYDNEYGFNPKN